MRVTVFKNKELIENSELCGCYYCLKIFKPNKIKRWLDEGLTATCPNCGVDSVVGDSQIEINKETLKELQNTRFYSLT